MSSSLEDFLHLSDVRKQSSLMAKLNAVRTAPKERRERTRTSAPLAASARDLATAASPVPHAQRTDDPRTPSVVERATSLLHQVEYDGADGDEDDVWAPLGTPRSVGPRPGQTPLPADRTTPVAVAGRLCDSCSGAHRAGATMFCLNCGGYLCTRCNEQLHPRGNGLMARHERVAIDDVRSQFCDEHGELDVTYFCLTCESRCVCTECVVHGAHAGHDVRLIRQALPIVRESMASIQDTIASRAEQLDRTRGDLVAQRRAITEESKVAKERTSAAFAQLHEALRERERQLLADVDEATRATVDEIDGYTCVLTEHVDGLLRVGDVVRADASRDDSVAVLNAYAEQKDAWMQSSRVQVPVPDVENLVDREWSVDVETLRRQIDAVDAVKVTIARQGRQRAPPAPQQSRVQRPGVAATAAPAAAAVPPRPARQVRMQPAMFPASSASPTSSPASPVRIERPVRTQPIFR